MPIKQYQKADQKLFRVTLKHLGVQRQKSGLTSLGEAKKTERDFIKAIDQQRYEHANAGLPLIVLINEWSKFASQESHFQTPESKMSVSDSVKVIELHAKHLLKSKILLIDRSDIMKVLVDMKDSGLSDNRLRYFVSSLRKILKWAEDFGKLRPQHSSYLLNDLFKRQRREERRPEVLSQIEIQKLLHCAKEAEHEWYYVWALALLTGCRNGELIALKWSDVDLQKCTLNVARSWNGRLRSEKSTKSNRFRTISINSDLKQILEELRPISASSGYVLPRPKDWMRGEQAKVLRLFCASIGIPSVRFHALRASFTTQLLASGVPINKVQKLGGWSDLKTLGIYNRLAGVDIQGATDVLQILPRVANLIPIRKAADSEA